MKYSTGNILPDSLTGAIFAIEGIADACVILNGPTGCKFYHSAVSNDQFVRSLSFDPLAYSEEYYFGQPRVPCTYLDGYDYVYGSKAKLEGALRMAAEKDYGLIVVINSPGAALIGDDLALLLAKEVRDIPCFAMENTGYSGTFGEGLSKALIQLFEQMALPPAETPRPRTVNLLGINIMQKYYDGNIAEMRRLLGLCGVEVLCVPGGQDSLETLRQVPEAALNVVVYPEYGQALAEYCEAVYKTPFVTPVAGPPVGFDAAEAFVKEIARRMDVSPNPALEDIEKARARSFLYLARYTSIFGMPKGAAFSVKGEISAVYALTRWLSEYLGMIPAAIETLDDDVPFFRAKLTDFLDSIGCGEALGRPVNKTPVQMVFADGTTIAQLKQCHNNCAAMEIALPSLGYLDVTRKTLFGGSGALLFIENILNGLRYTQG